LIDGCVYVYCDGLCGDTLKKWNALAQKESESALVEKADNYKLKLGGE